VSARTPADLLFAGELPGPETSIVYTREAPPSWPRPPARLMAADLAALDGASAQDVTAYVCGSTGFCNAAGELLLGHGVAAPRIRTERFGPSG
jgi:ferredoxin-NADP reductase